MHFKENFTNSVHKQHTLNKIVQAKRLDYLKENCLKYLRHGHKLTYCAEFLQMASRVTSRMTSRMTPKWRHEQTFLNGVPNSRLKWRPEWHPE